VAPEQGEHPGGWDDGVGHPAADGNLAPPSWILAETFLIYPPRMQGTKSDLWQRLRSLESSCDVKVESILPDCGGDRVWWVTVRHRDDLKESPVVAAGRDAIEALTRALDEATDRGWQPG
jgi:hypothetical protein